MALTKIGKEGITGISNASDATAITITSGENVGIGTTDPGTSKLYLQDNHTTDVTNAATMIANTVFSINGNASEGSDVLRVGPMSSAGAYFMEVSNSAGNAAYNLCLNPINGGNVGIGTTSPATALHVNDATNATLTLEGDSSAGSSFINFAADGAATKSQISGAKEGGSGGDLKFSTNNAGGTLTQRMRIDAAGDLFVQRIYDNVTSGGANVRVQSNGLLQRDNSSRRYKNTIEDATHGLAELLTLRTVTYKGNNDGDTVFGGLIAEEVHDSGLTEFVSYNDEGEPEALAYGNMVSLCIKALQELSEKNDALEARITTLEG
jgi:hypothetical protein